MVVWGFFCVQNGIHYKEYLVGNIWLLRLGQNVFEHKVSSALGPSCDLHLQTRRAIHLRNTIPKHALVTQDYLTSSALGTTPSKCQWIQQRSYLGSSCHSGAAL